MEPDTIRREPRPAEPKPWWRKLKWWMFPFLPVAAVLFIWSVVLIELGVLFRRLTYWAYPD